MKSFHTFRLDTVNHCLWCEGERLPLAPKAFDVLRYLVEHADRLVTQDEILEALWPETYVNPEIVKKYILGIRKVLGDQRDKPTFVATFPRRGYQFIASVRDETALAVSSAPTAKSVRKIVGREGALRQLENAFDKALQGHRQIIFITGEAGIGKTTLVDVFLQGAVSAKARVARGQCMEGFGGKEAYYPILDALGHLCREADDKRIVQELATRAPTWLVQFPSLVSTQQRQALEKETFGATRERMVREICETLEVVAAETPLILLLEDLHWVDPSTLDFISALARRRGRAKLLLFGTYRPAEVIISRSPLKALKQDLVIHDLSQEVSLERLEEVDVAKYISESFVDGDFPAGFASLIYRRSGGNALFMVTILQDIAKKGLIAQIDGKWKLGAPIETVAQSVPETLDQLIDAQFQQLSAVEQRVLRSASVAGERFSAWAVSTAAEIDPGEIEEVCEGMVAKLQFIERAGIKEQSNGELSALYEFRHSLYREVLYGRLSESARSKLHLLLAQRLKSLCDPCEQESAMDLALHFEGGRDYEQAVNYLLVAADNAVRRFAYRDCIEILRLAHELVQKLNPRVRAEIEVRILGFIGHAHFALGDLVDSAQKYTDAAALAGQAGLKAAQTHALTCTMYPLGFIGPEDGVAALEEALKISKSVNDPPRVALTQMLASGFRLVFHSWSETHAELCTSAYETLLRQYPSELDPYQRIIFAHILMLKGKYTEALDLCERNVSEVSSSWVGQVVNFLSHFGALSAKIVIFLRTGQLGQVLRIVRAGRSSPDENLSLYWLLTLREATLRTMAFDFEGARQISQISRTMREGEFPDPQFYSIDQIAAGNIALQHRKYSEALEFFRNVQELDAHAKFFMHWQWRMVADLESSNAWLLSGNAANARPLADGLLKSALATSDPYLHMIAWDLQARVAMAEHDSPAARESIQQALAIANGSELESGAWQTFATASQVYRNAREFKTAKTHRDRAEACIFKIADSFDPEEPLRAIFLAAPPVQRVLSQRAMGNA
ncbi:MAG TPA: AAA family ATPase [Candidatus Acidoferrum sp.]|jgi:DNA-binding winged helix-turn-helix (wHTH) protein/tetratricopeptide (TPR) repeat protein